MGEKYGSKKAIADYIECLIYKTIIQSIKTNRLDGFPDFCLSLYAQG